MVTVQLQATAVVMNWVAVVAKKLPLTQTLTLARTKLFRMVMEAIFPEHAKLPPLHFNPNPE